MVDTHVLSPVPVALVDESGPAPEVRKLLRVFTIPSLEELPLAIPLCKNCILMRGPARRYTCMRGVRNLPSLVSQYMSGRVPWMLDNNELRSTLRTRNEGPSDHPMLRVLVGIDAYMRGPRTVAVSDVTTLQVVLHASALGTTGLLDQVARQVRVRFLCEVRPRFLNVVQGVQRNDRRTVLASARPSPDPMELPHAAMRLTIN